MKYVAIIVVIVIHAVAAWAGDVEPAGIESYLGFAVPHPRAETEMIYTVEDARILLVRDIFVTMIIGESGKIKGLTGPVDSIPELKPLFKRLKKIRFEFSEGRSVADSIIIPAVISLKRLPTGEMSAELKLPIDSGNKSDSVLLGEFYRANGISPPVITSLPPIFYKVHPGNENPGLLTITAWITLDADGNLIEVSFPIAGQDEMTHAVFMGLMNATFGPAAINGEPFATGFLVTFRIFDNIKYPFSPTQAPDTSKAPIITEQYFMTTYYNRNDISVPPLPRKHPGGLIRSDKYGRSGAGFARARVLIDTTGQIVSVSVLSAAPGLVGTVPAALRLATWYPATNAEQKVTAFSGEIILKFEASSQIRYSPVWLNDESAIR
jgi:hypothetical protein